MLNKKKDIFDLPFDFQPSVQSVRHSKHYDPKWKMHRRLKVQPIDLSRFQPDYKVTREEFRSRLKNMGLLPPRHWNERPVFISATEEIMEPYIPPEGDGKFSIISKTVRF